MVVGICSWPAVGKLPNWQLREDVNHHRPSTTMRSIQIIYSVLAIMLIDRCSNEISAHWKTSFGILSWDVWLYKVAIFFFHLVRLHSRYAITSARKETTAHEIVQEDTEDQRYTPIFLQHPDRFKSFVKQWSCQIYGICHASFCLLYTFTQSFYTLVWSFLMVEGYKQIFFF